MRILSLLSILLVSVLFFACQNMEEPETANELSLLHQAESLLEQAEEYQNADHLNKAIELLEPMADEGNAQAQFVLANAIFDEREEEAITLWRSAASQGHSGAKLNIGALVYMREGKHAEAIEWIQPAAEEGIAEAQYFLSICFQKGHAETGDFDNAVYWLQQAASNGHKHASQQLHSMKSQGLL